MSTKTKTFKDKERLMDIVQMRIDGYTLQEIADKYGVTKQCIQQKLSVISGNAKPRPGEIDEDIIFPNLAEWMAYNRIPKYELSKMIGMTPKTTTGLNAKLYGKRDFTMTEIRKLLEITGETFEYLFEKKEENSHVET